MPASSTLDVYLRLHCEADWREKQIKVFGYLTRLVGLTIGQFASCKRGWATGLRPLAQRLSLASAFFSTSRRLLWLGRIVQNVQWVRHALRETDAVTRWISLAGIGFGSMCNILDDLITLDRVGILAAGIIDVGRMLTATSRLWMSLTLCTFALNRIRLARLSREQVALHAALRNSESKNKNTTDEELQSNLFQLRISRLSEYKLLADLCMNVAYSFNVQMGDSWFASCGLVSGLLAMHKIWVCTRQTESLEIGEAGLQLPSTKLTGRQTRKRKMATTTLGRTLGRRRRSLGQLPAIAPRPRMSAHEQLQRAASFCFDSANCVLINEGEDEDKEEEADGDDGEYQNNHGQDNDGPTNRLQSNGTIYSPTSTMTAAELRRIMSSARIGSILELEQIARQERQERDMEASELNFVDT